MRPDPAASPAPSYLALGVTVVTLALAYGVFRLLSRAQGQTATIEGLTTMDSGGGLG